MKAAQRFDALKLAAADRRELRRLCGAGQQTTARIWRRIQTLLMLDRGMTLSATARALGTYPREVSRVARRYLDEGLKYALDVDDLCFGEIVIFACRPFSRIREVFGFTRIEDCGAGQLGCEMHF